MDASHAQQHSQPCALAGNRTYNHAGSLFSRQFEPAPETFEAAPERQFEPVLMAFEAAPEQPFEAVAKALQTQREATA